MELTYQYAWLIPVLPLAGATIAGLGLILVGEAMYRLRQAIAEKIPFL